MDTAQIEALIRQALELEELHVKFDGSQCSIIAVSDIFDTMSRVKRQQTIYAPLNDAINSGEIHAVTIKTFNTAHMADGHLLRA